MFSVAALRPLGAAQVAYCLAGLGEIGLAPALELLSKAECDRAQRIANAEYRLQMLKARALLRWMLARYTGCSPRSFEFEEGNGARPQLRHNPWGVHFSVSHSGEQVAAAVSTAPLGVDIERIVEDRSWPDIAAVCFHDSERALLECDAGNAARDAFFDIWTRKEAYLKAIGTGLDTDPATFSTASPDQAVHVDGADPRSTEWYSHSIGAPAGYKAALATSSPQPDLIHCRLDEALVGYGEDALGFDSASVGVRAA